MISRLFSKLLQAPVPPAVPMAVLPRAAVVRVKISMPPEDVWLTKRMNDIDICSRAQAERLVQAGMIKVDGQRVYENIKVNENNKIEIASRKDTNTQLMPIAEQTRLWLFYKPRGFTSTLKDPYNRPTIYHYLDRTQFPRITVYTIGHLDFHSEGLMLLTNSEDLANSAEFRFSKMKRKYEMRVNGKVPKRVLEEIKSGYKSYLRRYKPMYVYMKKSAPKSKNVWIDAILTNSHPREIRSIFERKRMHVNRLIRNTYGPYKLSGLKPGDFRETSIHLHLHKLLFKYYKEKSLKQ